MAPAPIVALTLPARAENLALCRLALVGLARALDIDTETLADLKLAVTEACSNAVRHAYGSDGGCIDVRFRLEGRTLEIEVEDNGRGLDADPGELDPVIPGRPGMGLAIIRALSDDLELLPGRDARGSLVRFRKDLG